jgi:reactive chlorine resistance protein C
MSAHTLRQQEEVSPMSMASEQITHPRRPNRAEWLGQTAGLKLQTFGTHVIRYGLVVVILWIGLMKFTAYEAVGIQPLVASSPLMGWMYSILSVREFSIGLGFAEIGIAVLIGVRRWFPKASAAGSAAAVAMFLITLSFLFSAPGWEPGLGGFPALSASVGQFLIKDVVLLGAAIWTCGEAYSA